MSDTQAGAPKKKFAYLSGINGIQKISLHFSIFEFDASEWDEETCRNIMLLPRPEAYIEAKI